MVEKNNDKLIYKNKQILTLFIYCITFKNIKKTPIQLCIISYSHDTTFHRIVENLPFYKAFRKRGQVFFMFTIQ